MAYLFWLFAGAVLLVGLNQAPFLVAPRIAQRMNLRGRRGQAVRLLERVLAVPSVTGEAAKVPARYHLALWYLHEKQYQQSAAEYTRLLKQRLPPGVEADVRQHLADCEEALGKEPEAERERQRATGLAGRRADVASLAAQAKWLRGQGRHAEACVLYERALTLTPAHRQDLRVQWMANLMVASFDAGNPTAAAKWAESTINAGAEGVIAILAHRMAAVGYADQGQLEQAEAHCRRSYELAVTSGQQDQAAQSLAYLGNIERKRGHLAEAIEAGQQAAAMGVGDRRVVLITVYECLRDLGRFEEAFEVHQQACAAPAYAQPAAERRSQAVLALGLSWLKAETGDGPGAWEALQRAVVELAREEKLNLWCEATAAWVYALLGREDQARQKIAEAEARAARFVQDRSTLLGTFSSLGRAAYALGDYRQGRSLWERYLALEPDVVAMPKALYFLGNCALQLNEREASRDFLQEAVSLGVETYYARLAGEQLRAEFQAAH